MTFYKHSTILSGKTSLFENNFDIFFMHGKAEKGFISTLQGKDKRQRTYKVSELENIVTNIDRSIDTYYTVNRFYAFSRKKIHCSHITCLFSDLDTYKTKYKDLPIEKTLELVLEECAKNYFPMPTTAMFSGRGIQLKWVFTEPERANFTSIKRFGEAQDAIQAMLVEFGSDTNAKDLSRVLRMEGTLHVDAQKYTYLMDLPGFHTYDLNHLHTLLDELIPEPVIKIVKEKKVKPVKAPKIKKEKEIIEKPAKKEFARTKLNLAVNNNKKETPIAFAKKGLLSLNTQRYLDLKRLARIRGNIEGQRMVFLMWIMNFKALAGQITPENFLEQAKIEADFLFTDGDYNLIDLITVQNKFVAQLAGEKTTYGGRSYLPLYTPKNRTLINIFEITAEEQQQLKTIIDDEEKLERHRVREMQRRRENGAVSREEYLENSITNAKPWEALGISRPTYYRRVKAGLINDNVIDNDVRQVRAVI